MESCVAVFDIGKTYKGFFLFNLQNEIIKEERNSFNDKQDNPANRCLDFTEVAHWVKATWKKAEADLNFDIKAVNFIADAGYFVHLDHTGEVVLPLCCSWKIEEENDRGSLNRYVGSSSTLCSGAEPQDIRRQFNSLKYERKDIFKKIACSLPLPQYLSFLLTGQMAMDYTSLSSYFMLWDTNIRNYLPWVHQEDFLELLPPIRPQGHLFRAPFRNKFILAGTGLVKQSAALVPYLKRLEEPFILLSLNNVWAVVLNPFPTKALPSANVLRYITHEGNAVTAVMTYLGTAFKDQIQRLSVHFGRRPDFYKLITFDSSLVPAYLPIRITEPDYELQAQPIERPQKYPLLADPALFPSYEAAYHYLMAQMAQSQADAISAVTHANAQPFKTLIVEGELSQNQLFMLLLQKAFPSVLIKQSYKPQSGALGAALLMEGKTVQKQVRQPIDKPWN